MPGTSKVGIARGAYGRETAMTALQDVGLADRARDWPAVLSGCQRQRVALARALVNHPSILLLGEPFGALDALTRAEMHQLITRIWRQHRFTAVLITHDVHEAITLADRVLVLRDGGIVLDELVSQPRPRALNDANLAAIEAAVLAAV
jgi:sulfonate transport system ATP-binding protein